jgi:uridine kinase
MSSEVLEYVNSLNVKLIGIVGGAGAGKSTLASNLTSTNKDFLHYSADYKFIGDSTFRKELLASKVKTSINNYIDACNQHNWWDWDSIVKDLTDLKNNKTVVMPLKYNRNKGITESGLTLLPTLQSKIIYEGALLGTPQVLNQLDKIIFVHTSQKIRLERLIKKDLGRRSLNEILARFLITEYSESKHYKFLFTYYKEKIVIVNDNYNFISINPNIIFENEQYIPLPIS